MKIFIKTPAEIASMKEGGRRLGIILKELAAFVAPNITTQNLEDRAKELFKKYEVKPSFLGYKGYPAALCTAVNEEVVHAIPCSRILRDGDIISIDAGACYEGLHTDSAITISVGQITPAIKKFISIGEEALSKAISLCRPGVRLEEISAIIEKTITNNGYKPIKELTGHGVGRLLHEDPLVLNYVDKSSPEIILAEGMTFAIEPIYAMGGAEIKTKSDKWTIITADGSLAAQVEHTVAITANSCEILTIRPVI
ncbi:type I methionyl aminopeptidase [Candidatus Peregrinibacteria bacterium]|nr:type I methionyl aminopeptidase [Candidatus Peregrinibacteria bacterium]